MKITIRKMHTFGVIEFKGVGSKQLYCQDMETAMALAVVIGSVLVSKPEIKRLEPAIRRTKKARASMALSGKAADYPMTKAHRTASK